MDFFHMEKALVSSDPTSSACPPRLAPSTAEQHRSSFVFNPGRAPGGSNELHADLGIWRKRQRFLSDSQRFKRSLDEHIAAPTMALDDAIRTVPTEISAEEHHFVMECQILALHKAGFSFRNIRRVIALMPVHQLVEDTVSDAQKVDEGAGKHMQTPRVFSFQPSLSPECRSERRLQTQTCAQYQSLLTSLTQQASKVRIHPPKAAKNWTVQMVQGGSMQAEVRDEARGDDLGEFFNRSRSSFPSFPSPPRPLLRLGVQSLPPSYFSTLVAATSCNRPCSSSADYSASSEADSVASASPQMTDVPAGQSLPIVRLDDPTLDGTSHPASNILEDPKLAVNTAVIDEAQICLSAQSCLVQTSAPTVPNIPSTGKYRLIPRPCMQRESLCLYPAEPMASRALLSADTMSVNDWEAHDAHMRRLEQSCPLRVSAKMPVTETTMVLVPGNSQHDSLGIPSPEPIVPISSPSADMISADKCEAHNTQMRRPVHSCRCQESVTSSPVTEAMIQYLRTKVKGATLSCSVRPHAPHGGYKPSHRRSWPQTVQRTVQKYNTEAIVFETLCVETRTSVDRYKILLAAYLQREQEAATAAFARTDNCDKISENIRSHFSASQCSEKQMNCESVEADQMAVNLDGDYKPSQLFPRPRAVELTVNEYELKAAAFEKFAADAHPGIVCHEIFAASIFSESRASLQTLERILILLLRLPLRYSDSHRERHLHLLALHGKPR
ncbi:hypothetical protein FB451DRAFT_1175219 [Mycena latifolia]|nr:hypothetical protein FB451DRAFT_1175219 [Mycena latifolia]